MEDTRCDNRLVPASHGLGSHGIELLVMNAELTKCHLYENG